MNLFPQILPAPTFSTLATYITHSEEYESMTDSQKLDVQMMQAMRYGEELPISCKHLIKDLFLTIEGNKYFLVDQFGQYPHKCRLVPYVVHPYCLPMEVLKVYEKNEWPIHHPDLHAAIELNGGTLYTGDSSEWAEAKFAKGESPSDIVQEFFDSFSDHVSQMEHNLRNEAILEFLGVDDDEEFEELVSEHDPRLKLTLDMVKEEYEDSYPEVTIDTSSVLNATCTFRLTLRSNDDHLHYRDLDPVIGSGSYLHDMFVALGVDDKEFFEKTPYGREEDEPWGTEDRGIVSAKGIAAEIADMGTGGMLTILVEVSIGDLYGKHENLDDLGTITIKKGSPVGIFDCVDGSGSPFSLETMKDMDITILEEIVPGCYWEFDTRGYSVEQVYGQRIRSHQIEIPSTEEEE